MDKSAVVLLSGGLDSVYNLYLAKEKWPQPGNVEALTFNYGQKAFAQELKAAQFFCEKLSIPHQVLDVANLFKADGSSLTSDQKEIPTTQVDINSQEASEKSATQVWVANRNGVLLNAAAAIAEAMGAQFIIPGFNAEEAATFPDNSVEFIEIMNQCLKFSTANGVQVQCFSQNLTKPEIAKGLLEREVPMDKIWSCYFPGEKPCGMCESCQRFNRALEKS